MPYTVSGKCVHKKNPDGSLGKREKCHETRAQAIKHMQALNIATAGEHKEIGMDEKEMELTEEESLEKGYVPYGVKSFDELEQMRAAAEIQRRAFDLTDDFIGIVHSILYDPDTADKASAIKSVADEYQNRVGSLDTDAMKELAEKAVWSTAYVNDLPDSAFLYVESGEKDSEGKTTPRSKRHLPYKDASGKVDLAHIRNAVARIPQMKGISSDKKASLQARARKILASANKEQKALIDDEIQIILDKAASDESFVDKLFNAVKSIGKPKESKPDRPLMVWKDASGRLRFLARYSNNFRDDDNPPEIISAKSHQRFVERADKGLVPYPELWVWHVKDWKVGQTDWLAYDDAGFALASGIVDKENEALVTRIAEQDDVAMSHGMPIKSIKRDPDDPSIIIEHDTEEISILPLQRAANKMTGFWVLTDSPESKEREDDPMSIPKNKVESLVSDWGVDPNLLEQLQMRNEVDAEKASGDGIESKEQDTSEETIEETTPTADAVDTSTEETAETAESESPSEESEKTDGNEAEYPTVQEVAEAVTNVLKPYIELQKQVVETITDLRKELDDLKSRKDSEKDDEQKQNLEMLKESTPASLVAILTKSLSAAQSEDTVIDGRSSLAKSKPAEAETTDVETRTGIPFIDAMLAGKPQESE